MQRRQKCFFLMTNPSRKKYLMKYIKYVCNNHNVEIKKYIMHNRKE